MKLTYSLSREYIKRVFIETGAEIPSEHSVELPADALTSELRAHLARTVGPRVPAEFTLTAYQADYSALRVIAVLGGRITLEQPASEDDGLQLLTLDARRWEQAEEERKVRAAERAENARAENARAAKEAEQRAAAALAEARERVRHEDERRAWIDAYGSVYLKKCLAGGYDCQRKYVVERAAVEHPGYIVDYNDAANWKDRAAPSEAAMGEAERVGGRVVWLTDAPSYAVRSRGDEDYGDGDDFSPCEAVVIRGYLNKYDLIRLV